MVAYECVLRRDAVPVFDAANEAEARRLFKRAIELNPGNAEVRLKLGETYAKQGDLPEAREQLRVLEEADPDAAKELCSIVAAASSENPLTLEP